MPNPLKPLDPQQLIATLNSATESLSGKQFFRQFIEALASQTGSLGVLGLRFDAELNALGVPSTRDEALGLLGQSDFLNALSLEFQRTQRHGRPLSILMLSIDRVEELDQTDAAELLYEVAAVLRNILRNSDLICRLAMDGFVMVLPETGTLGAKDASEKIRQAVAGQAAPEAITGQQGHATCSIGMAVVSGIERSHEEILSLADRALAEARRAGGNRICSALGIV